MKPDQPTTKKGNRSPGERAFDRSFLPLAFFIAAFVVRVRSGAPSSAALVMAIARCISWLWALVSVLVAWHDPTARWLRFSALGLLLLVIALVFSMLFARGP
jgi:hypothetical protein